MKIGALIANGLLAAGFACGLSEADAAGPKRSSKTKPPGPVVADRCITQKCTVQVAVSNCVITVKPEVLIVGSKIQGIEITWQIPPSSKYTFAANGIEIKETARDVSKQFEVQKTADRHKFVLTDKNTESGIVFYSVTVLDPNRKPCPTLDPPIINEY